MTTPACIAIGFTGLYVLVTLRWLVGLCQRASRPMPKPGLLQLNPNIFSRTTSALNPPCDNRRMAATVVEGTARKLVTRKCGRTMTKSEDRGDSRRDGRGSIYADLKHAAEWLEFVRKMNGK